MLYMNVPQWKKSPCAYYERVQQAEHYLFGTQISHDSAVLGLVARFDLYSLEGKFRHRNRC